MTLDIRDLVILALIVLNIAQVFITRGHIPPALVDKLFDFAAAKAAQTPDPEDDKTIAELRSIANALLNAQPPATSTETTKTVTTTETAPMLVPGLVPAISNSTSIASSPSTTYTVSTSATTTTPADTKLE